MDPRRFKTARPMARLREGRTDWYRIEARAATSSVDVYVYDEIGWFGLTAADFVKDLASAAEGAKQINLHVNSPGGDVFDGIAIGNALRSHPADVTVYIDGLAASIASVIAMAGNEVVMGRNAQMMIHDASGLCLGNAEDMTEMAKMLAMISDNIADVYATRAGGDVKDWRARMKAETWYTADEAVEAGLADRVAAVSAQDEEAASKARASWDLSIYAYQGRDGAPPPDLGMPTGARNGLADAPTALPVEPDVAEEAGLLVPEALADLFAAAWDPDAFRAGLDRAVAPVAYEPVMLRSAIEAAAANAAELPRPAAVVPVQTAPVEPEPVAPERTLRDVFAQAVEAITEDTPALPAPVAELPVPTIPEPEPEPEPAEQTLRDVFAENVAAIAENAPAVPAPVAALPVPTAPEPEPDREPERLAPISMAEIFRSAVLLAANDAPAPQAPPLPVPPEAPDEDLEQYRIDPVEMYSALMKAW